jgi:hypothetical protein
MGLYEQRENLQLKAQVLLLRRKVLMQSARKRNNDQSIF